MAKKREPVPATIETKYTDSVTLTKGDGPLRPSDLRRLLDTVENEVFLDNDRAEVTVLDGYSFGAGRPSITVTHVVKNEEAL